MEQNFHTIPEDNRESTHQLCTAYLQTLLSENKISNVLKYYIFLNKIYTCKEFYKFLKNIFIERLNTNIENHTSKMGGLVNYPKELMNTTQAEKENFASNPKGPFPVPPIRILSLLP